jgi:3-oxoadipate enol-lactonase
MSAVAVHHEVSGPPGAPVVLLSNSLGSSLAMWDPQMADLAERYQVVRYDLRGHGRSPAPDGPYTVPDLVADALALLDRLDVERAHLVGLSLGGMVSLRLATAAPQRVDRMVLCCTSAYLPPASTWYDRAATVRADGVGAVAEAVVGRWLTPAFAAASPALVAELRAMVEATPDEGYASCCEAIATMDLRPWLRDITAPTLLVAGADDPATPVDHAEAIAAELPDARTVVVGPAAHLANVEQPTAVGQHILSHLGNGGPA